MASGAQKLEEHLSRIRELAKFADRAAPVVRDELRREIVRSSRAQESPAGLSWRPPETVEGRILRHVDDHLRVRAVGTTIVATLTGRYARHHLGAVRGGAGKTPRRIIPNDLSRVTARAIDRAVTAEFRRIMGEAAQ